MKKSHFLFCFLFFGIGAVAQKHDPVNNKTDSREFKGYTIKLLPAASGTYGYDVWRGTGRVIHQSRNPFNFSPRGLASKEDAYKLAQWQIEQLSSRPNLATRQAPSGADSRRFSVTVAQKHGAKVKGFAASNGRLSPKVAKDLKITITR